MSASSSAGEHMLKSDTYQMGNGCNKGRGNQTKLTLWHKSRFLQTQATKRESVESPRVWTLFDWHGHDPCNSPMVKPIPRLWTRGRANVSTRTRLLRCTQCSILEQCAPHDAVTVTPAKAGRHARYTSVAQKRESRRGQLRPRSGGSRTNSRSMDVAHLRTARTHTQRRVLGMGFACVHSIVGGERAHRHTLKKTDIEADPATQ